MAQAKIELKIGNFQFSGEGDAGWLEKQLDKLLEHVKGIDPADLHEDDDPEKPRRRKTKETLSAYLKASSATTNQVKKFLATACWLTEKGTEHLATSDISKALSDNRQGKLKNASECLNKNVNKGNCEKEGKQFYVTEEGFASLGRTTE